MTTIALKPNSGPILTQIRLGGESRRGLVISSKSKGCVDFPKLMPGDSNTQIRRLQDASPGEL